MIPVERARTACNPANRRPPKEARSITDRILASSRLGGGENAKEAICSQVFPNQAADGELDRGQSNSLTQQHEGISRKIEPRRLACK
jgi:hypothetical protein